jgi:hypothetical protein
MTFGPPAAVFGAVLVFAAAEPMRAADPVRADVTVPVAAPDGATIFRVFLTDGTTLVSYGEPARVGDRIVFSMPTSASLDTPPLHLVNLAANHVDWARTERYAETARATRYYETNAEADYAELTGQVATALADVAMTPDASARIAIVEKARKALAEWPRNHFNYRQAEIGPMLGMLDEIVAELRATAGIERFDLSFVAGADAPVIREPLVPLPTPREAIEQVLTVARIADSPADRLSLLSVALGSIERDAVRLPSDWRTEARASIRATISAELEMDRHYQLLTTRILRTAGERARSADVRGIQRLTAEIEARDRLLGEKRPDAVAALMASVQAQLDAARRLRLARDRFALRLPAFRTYGNSMTTPLYRLDRLQTPLEDIKALAGSSPFALATIQKTAAQAMKTLSAIAPPDEFQAVHALFVSAAQLADDAAKIRLEAALTGDLQRAWDASSAAAGALMLAARARTEFQSLFRLPRLDQ